MGERPKRSPVGRLGRWRREVAALVADAVPGYQDPQALPHDLNSVARRLGVSDIKYLARDVHGFTDWSTARPTVYLATSRSDGRRRFTLGHECGHIMLGHGGANAARNAFITPPLLSDPELTCDAVSAELLLPFTWLDEFGEYIVDLETASVAANRLRISLATLIVRMGHWGARPCLFRLEAASGRWIVVNRVGVPASLRGRVTLDDDTHRAMTMLNNGNHNLSVTFHDTAGAATTMSANVRKIDTGMTVYIPTAGATALP